MTRSICAVCALALIAGPARAGDVKDPATILDKAIKALGGANALAKVKAYTWKSKGTISLGGNDSEFTLQGALRGIDHARQEFELNINDMKVVGLTVIAGDKGWRKFGDMSMELDKDALGNEKRNVYLLAIPTTLLPLKDKGFKLEPGGEDKVNGKPAVGIKATAPDGKDFTLYFDKESGLPAKQVAKVIGFMGEEAAQETTYADWKEFQGIKKATKLETKRDGARFVEQTITEFRVLDKVEDKLFAEPQ
jgi:hypothetical protein